MPYHNGAETSAGSYWYAHAKEAVADFLDEHPVSLTLPPEYLDRPAWIVPRGPKVGFEVKRQKGESLPGWDGSSPYRWQKVFHLPKGKVDSIRRVHTIKGDPFGWFAQSEAGVWQRLPLSEVKCRLLALGIPTQDVGACAGGFIGKPWLLTMIPFADEYPEPGKRVWNKNRPTLRHDPKPGPHPHWDMIFSHAFNGLDPALKGSDEEADFPTGRDYGIAWVASTLQKPFEPLPMLYLFGPENCGKSIIHEAVSECLFTSGVASAHSALTHDKNGELDGAVLAIIEERDIASNPVAYPRLKDLITAKTLWLRKMYTDPFPVRNSLHFLMCANDRNKCPARLGDTRIIFCPVKKLTHEIPKPILMERLEEEAPHFTHTLVNLELPAAKGRLQLPTINTRDKEEAIQEAASEFAAAVIDFMNDKKEWTGTRAELAVAVGFKSYGTYQIRRELGDPCLKREGIEVAECKKGNKGKVVQLKHTN